MSIDRIDIRGNFPLFGPSAAGHPIPESGTRITASGHPPPEGMNEVKASGNPMPKSTLDMTENLVPLVTIPKPEGSMPTDSVQAPVLKIEIPNGTVYESTTDKKIGFFEYIGQKIRQIFGKKH
jgi:hypothetical protein